MTATNSYRVRPVHRRRLAVVALALAALTSGAGGIYVAAETKPTPQPVAVTAAPPPPAASAPARVAAPPAVRAAAPSTTKRKSPVTTTTKATTRKPAASTGDPADSPFCSKNPDLCTNGVPDKKSDRAAYQNDPRSNAEINSDQPMYAPEGTCPGGYARIAGIC